MEDWVTIRNLKSKNHKISNREIGRLLHISHNTVKKVLLNEEGPKYQRQSAVIKEIDTYRSFIEEKYLVKQLAKCRIFNDIKSKGYQGSKSSFYRYLSKLQPTNIRVFQPYETNPGEQSQFDWSEYTVTIADHLTKIYVFSYILGYSRYRIYEASLCQTQSSIFEALENSFIETGGVTERIQTDNAKSFIVHAGKDNVQFNPRYLQFCGHYSIKPTRSLPKHPWSKGKVERTFDYLETHFIEGNEFDSFEDFVKRLKKFQDEVNNKVHTTTKQKPNDLFYLELSSLSKLPDNRFVDIKEQVRKVTSDCLISFMGNRYSVPYIFATKEVWVKVSKGFYLHIYSQQNKLIAEHQIALGKGNVVINEDHYKNHFVDKGNWQRLIHSFLQDFPEYLWFIDKLKTQKRINPGYHLTQILGLLKFYKSNDLIEAFTACDKYNTYSINFISGYLQNNCKLEKTIPVPINDSKISHQNNPSITRPLSDYKLFIDQ